MFRLIVILAVFCTASSSWASPLVHHEQQDPTLGIPYLAIQAESFTQITDEDTDTINNDEWLLFDDPFAHNGAATIYVGPNIKQDTSLPSYWTTEFLGEHEAYVSFDVIFNTPGSYKLATRVRAGGFYDAPRPNGQSDSMWLPSHPFGAGNLSLDSTPNTTAFLGGWPNKELFNWTKFSNYTLVVDSTHIGNPMTLHIGGREKGAVLDALVFAPTVLSDENLDHLLDTAFPAFFREGEDYDRIQNNGGNSWSEPTSPNTGSFSFFTGDSWMEISNSDSANPDASLEYDIVINTPGLYQLDTRVGGVDADLSLLTASIDGVDLLSGNALSGLQVSSSALWEWLDAGLWAIQTPGTYTVRLNSSDSGVSVDSLRLNFYSALISVNTPEPSSFMLLGSCLVAVRIAKQRREASIKA